MKSGKTLGYYRFMWMETLTSVFINATINFAVACYVFRSVESIMLRGNQGLLIDLVATAILMPFFMTIVMTRILQRKVRKKKLPFFPRKKGKTAFYRLASRGPVIRGLLLSCLSLLTILPVSCAVLLFWGPFPILFRDVVIFKFIFGGMTAALVTPPIITWALSD